MKNWQALLEEQNAVLVRIDQEGMSHYAHSLDNLTDAIDNDGREPAHCMDEGTRAFIKVSGGCFMPGWRADEMTRFASESRIPGFATHGGCAAGFLEFCRIHPKDGKKMESQGQIDWGVVDSFVQEIATNTATRVFNDPSFYMRHIPAAKLTRPGYHIHAVIYVAAMPFNYHMVPGLPPGLTVTVAHQTTERALITLRIALEVTRKAGIGERAPTRWNVLMVPIGHPSKPDLSTESITKLIRLLTPAELTGVKIDPIIF